LLLVLEGSIEATVGDETGRLETGAMAVVPAHLPHGARNDGDETARVIGFFTAGTIVSHFAEPLVPEGPQQIVNGSPVVPFELPSTLPV
jgi:quercetin dioxygenase-like cupin family protein